MSTENQEMRVTEDITPEQRAAEILSSRPAAGEAAQPAAPQKRGRGRPKGSRTRTRPASNRAAARVDGRTVEVEMSRSPEEVQREVEEEAKQIAPLLRMVVSLVTDRIAPERPYSIEDAQMLALAAVPVFNKYGGAANPYKEEIALCVVAFSQAFIYYQLVKQRQQQSEEAPA